MVDYEGLAREWGISPEEVMMMSEQQRLARAIVTLMNAGLASIKGRDIHLINPETGQIKVWQNKIQY